MNTAQVQFTNILSSVIYNKDIENYSMGKIKWKSIIEEAKAHNVMGLVYSAVNRSGYIKKIEKRKLEQLKKDTFLTAITQIQHVEQITKVLNIINKNKIPVIVLKGLVLRELYPRPELRTMSDADILVKKDDIDKVKNLLIDLGYIVSSYNAAHIVFKHKNYFTIEVHWTLANRNFFKGKLMFEKNIWENKVKVTIGEIEILSLSYENLAIHLCIHMAVHSVGSGFGVRQLCDFVLLVQKKGDRINWLSFMGKIRESGIEKFTIAIFLICEKVFKIAIPSEIRNTNIFLDEKVLNRLIDDIFEGGVHGKRNLSKMFGRELAYDTQYNNDLSMFKRFIIVLFPPISKLSDSYVYAKKYKILIPIAWIHHFLCGAFNKKYKFFSKIKFLILTVSISKKRNKLLKQLELI